MGQLVLSILLILNLAFITSCAKDKESNSSPVHPIEIGLIKTVRVIRKNFIQKVAGYGYIKPLRKADIVVYTQGIIKNIWVKNGDKVKKGQRILSIEGYYRIKAKESGTSYGLNSDNDNIVKIAPISGRVLLFCRSVGSAVNSGKIVASIIDLKSLLAEVEVFGDKISFIKVGQTTLIIHNHNEMVGKVVSISPTVDPKTGGKTIGIRVGASKSPNLFPGDFVKAEIIIKKHIKSVAIPKSAVLNDNGKKVVIIRTEKGYKKINIIVGIEDNEYIEVLSGLKGNEVVITAGAYELLNKNIREKIKLED
jgi:cobalt-zinc-cadmium efflux system membrane fusion protein